MNALSPATLRRGWCPSTLRPMQTGDGWLVRLHPPGACFSPRQLMQIAALAQRFGNGLIEISARANLQLRGVSEATHPALVEALLQERLVDEYDGDGPQRLVLTSPLIGCDGAFFDAGAVSAAIESEGRAVSGLPAKFSVVVDGGGALALDAVSADIRLRGLGPAQIAIGLPHGLWFGPVDAANSVASVAKLLRRFAAFRRANPDLRRLRDCGATDLAALIDLSPCEPPAARPAPKRAGLFDCGEDGFAAMAALPFGRCHGDQLTRLGRTAQALHVGVIRLTPWRGLACLGLDRPFAQSWLDRAEALGLIVADADPRLSVQACAGKPACLRAQADAMADAAMLAAALAPELQKGLSLHVSGCVKACAHPAAADLTLVGDGGVYDVVIGGTTRDQPIARLDLAAILARLRPGQDLSNRLDTLLGSAV